MEQMLMTQALDERDFLSKKINDTIARTVFVDYAIGSKKETVVFTKNKEDFEKEVQSEYQSIMDLIDRYERLEAAICNSNGTTKINITGYGEITVANAIILRTRLKNGGMGNKSFRYKLAEAFSRQFREISNKVDAVNSDVKRQAENLRNNILSKSDSESADKKNDIFKVVDNFVESNSAKVVDPLGIVSAATVLETNTLSIIKDIDSKIKISNATTMVEF